MANCRELWKFILKHEGKIANHPLDRGGFTNKGVTLAVWKLWGKDLDGDGKITVTDLIRMSDEDLYQCILKPHYWDKWRADDITNQSIANILVDWVWGSGSWGITIPQKILGVKDDGIVGKKTLEAVNKYDPMTLFSKIKQERKMFLYRIVIAHPEQKVFLKGWLNRLNDLKYVDK